MKELFLLLVLLVAVSCQGAPLTARDNHKFARISAPLVSADAQWAVYTRRIWNEQTSKVTTNLEIMNLATNANRTLTAPSEGVADFSPIFTADSKYVLFLSSRSDDATLYSVPVTGYEADIKTVASFPVDIDNLKMSPTGDFFVFSAEVYLSCSNGDLQCTADLDAEEAKKGANKGVLYDQLFVRHWDAWLTSKRPHLFLQKISTTSGGVQLVGAPRDLLYGMNANSPVPPDGDSSQYDISNDGSEIAFTCEFNNKNVSWTTSWRVYSVSTTGQSEPKWLTGFTVARTQNPKYSPDSASRYIAYLAHDRQGLEADKLHFNIYDRQTQQTKSFSSAAIDISFEDFDWLPGGNGFIASGESQGFVKLFHFDIATQQVTELISNGTNSGFSFIPNSYNVILSRDFYTSPAELYRFTFYEGKAVGLYRVTAYNHAALSQFYIARPESVYFPGANNEKVQMFVFKPINFDPAKKYPVANLIHGGPQGAFNDGWSYRWNPQLWASRGYVVVAINIHGSTGFGQAFVDSVAGEWGGIPYIDLIKGINYVIDNYPFVDSTRIAGLGGSYGGYMVNWINGQASQARSLHGAKFDYQCLVSHDGVFDTVSSAYATDELWSAEADFGGTPYDRAEQYEKWNPRNYVKYMTTPTLIIHGGMDFRLSVSEANSMFTALQRRAVPSKYLFFPRENHWVLKPENSIMWYQEVLAFLDEWTAPHKTSMSLKLKQVNH